MQDPTLIGACVECLVFHHALLHTCYFSLQSVQTVLQKHSDWLNQCAWCCCAVHHLCTLDRRTVEVVCWMPCNLQTPSRTAGTFVGAVCDLSALCCRTTQTGLVNVLGALYATTLFFSIINATVIQPVIWAERAVSYRERAAGMYSVFSFTLALVWTPSLNSCLAVTSS